MAWLTAQDEFDPDQLPNNVLGIAAALSQHDSGVHRHKMGQLLFSRQGCICITLNQNICILPPARLAWIPPWVEHRAEVTSVVGYRSIYLDTHRYPVLPLQLEVLATTPLLQEVLERIACADFDTDWEQGAPSNILAVCLDEISIARRELRYRLIYAEASAIFASKGIPDFSTPYASCNNLRIAAQTPTFPPL